LATRHHAADLYYRSGGGHDSHIKQRQPLFPVDADSALRYDNETGLPDAKEQEFEIRRFDLLSA
jgi:hypothetical protein